MTAHGIPAMRVASGDGNRLASPVSLPSTRHVRVTTASLANDATRAADERMPLDPFAGTSRRGAEQIVRESGAKPLTPVLGCGQCVGLKADPQPSGGHASA